MEYDSWSSSSGSRTPPLHLWTGDDAQQGLGQRVALTTENGELTVQNGGLLWLIYVNIWLMMVNKDYYG